MALGVIKCYQFWSQSHFYTNIFKWKSETVINSKLSMFYALGSGIPLCKYVFEIVNLLWVDISNFLYILMLTKQKQWKWIFFKLYLIILKYFRKIQHLLDWANSGFFFCNNKWLNCTMFLFWSLLYLFFYNLPRTQLSSRLL